MTERHRSTSQEVYEFVKFCLLSPYADEIAEAPRPHIKATQLYQQLYGITIHPRTAKRQQNKWTAVNGTIYRNF